MDELQSGPLMVKSLTEDTLRLSYPRSMVGEPMLKCGIMR
jgi:hypothetical protein